ncbi:MAG: DUF2269 domain-containing protein [Planctomycetota bacterium]|mgnify:CR=1 FL=1
MSWFFVIKALHLLGVSFFLGGGSLIAYYKLRADASKDIHIIAWVHREIVLADFLVTIPSGIVVLSTGLYMAHLLSLSISTPWVFLALLSFSMAGICWLPAAFLQVRMRNLTQEALKNNATLPPAYHRASLIWTLLGVPSFGAVLFTLWLMISKWYP